MLLSPHLAEKCVMTMTVSQRFSIKGIYLGSNNKLPRRIFFTYGEFS